MPGPVQIGIALLYLLGITIYIFTGLRKANTRQDTNESSLAFWQGTLRYVIAFDLCVFGIGKFFNIQFHTPLTWLDSPYSSLSPHHLFWAFFGYFYAFPRIIGAMQIAGSLMLLFRKTRLFGVVFLMPILLNILLLDSFYLVGTVYYIAIETAGLIYLLLIEYKRLYNFFFIDDSNLPHYQFSSPKWKTVLRVSVIIVPLLLMFIHENPQYYPEIDGEYVVDKLSINNIPQNLAACHDSILTKVYIDKNDLVFEYNSYKKRIAGQYKYNRATRQITAIWYASHHQSDTLVAEILFSKNPAIKTLSGHMGKDVFKTEMVKVSPLN